MNDLRVGGLVSGLDTNAIIESMMTTAKEPINRLNQQINSLNLEKKTYNGIITSFNDIKSALLPLKLESTFKSKLTSSSDEAIGKATSTIETPPGSYLLDVINLAKNSMATSSNPNIAFYPGAGVTTATVTDAFRNQLFGSHGFTTYKRDDNKIIATDSFRPSDGRTFDKYTGGKIDANGPINEYGVYRHDPVAADAITVKVTVHGTPTPTTTTVSVSLQELDNKLASPADPKVAPINLSIQTVAAELETKINAEFNAQGDLQSQKVAVKVELDNDGTYKIAMYDTDKTNAITFEVKNTPAAKDLGLTTMGNKSVTQIITHQFLDTKYEDLTARLTAQEHGIIPNIKFTSEALMKDGSFTIIYDDTMNKKIPTKSTFFGGSFDTITTKDNKLLSTVTEEQIKQWLNTPMEKTVLNDAKGDPTTTPTFFDTKNAPIGGYFHINGVKIDTKVALTPSQLLAKINSSGAGVTASWNYEGHYFQIENNKAGTDHIVIGQDGDTSNMLGMLNTTIPSGALYVRGSDSGTIDVNAKVTEAGFSQIPVEGIFTINGVSIYLDSADTVNDIMSKVNKSGANVTLSYDKNIDKFKLTSKSGTGKIEVGSPNDKSTFLKSIGVIPGDSSTVQTIGTEGQKATFTIDGLPYERDSNIVTDAITGMNITLIGAGKTTLSVTIDTDRAVDAMAGFAANYNKLMEMLSPDPITKDDREKYATPLTDATAKEMSADDIKDYQKNFERIKNYDVISSSSELRFLKTQIRSNLTAKMITNSPIKSLLDMGFNIAGANSGDYTVTPLGFFIDVSTDKDELKKKISDSGLFANIVENSSDDVFKFFAENKDTKVDNVAVPYRGFATKYDTFVTSSSNSSSILYKKSGINGVIDNQITRLQQQVETQTKRAESYLERMWAEFAAMETRMQRIQDQSAALAKIGSGASQ